MKGTFLLFSGLQIFSVTAFGQCIDTKDPSVPACPIGKTQALDDRYPAAYVTVGPGQGNDQLGFDFAKKAFAAGKPTKIVLSGWKVEQYDSLKESLKKSGFTDDEIKQRLIHFDTGTSYQWQQDFVQPEFNPATGAPEMRPINSYLSRRTSVTDDQQYFSQLANKLNDQKVFCNAFVKTGKILPETLKEQHESNYFGGNLEGFPGGLCMVGDTLPEESLQDFCKGKPENMVKLPASWLKVGHVDEAFSVVKDTKAKPPCNYAVLRASPKKALDLLQSSLTNPEIAQKKFLELNEGDRNTATLVCDTRESLEKNRSRLRSVPASEDSKTLKGASLFKSFNLISNANAGVGVIITGSGTDVSPCNEMSNKEAYDAINFNHEIFDFNMLVEEEMIKAEKEIKEKSASNGCPNIKVLPVPNLFRGNVKSELINSDEIISVKLVDGTTLKKKRSEFTEDEMNLIPHRDRIELFKMKIDPRTGKSINPNPTNSVSLNQTLIFPEQKNSIFSDYLKKDIAENLGLNSSFVNTWQSAHTSDGNLHCSTNTFRYCRPSSDSSK